MSKMKIEKLFRKFVDNFYFTGIMILGFVQIYILTEIILLLEDIFLKYLVGIAGAFGIIAFVSKHALDELDKKEKKE